MKIKTKEGEEREMIEMEYEKGKPFAIFITLFLVLIATIIGGAYFVAFIIEKLTKAGIL